MSDKIEEKWEGEAEVDRLNKENWELNQRLGKAENYIKFKSLWENFMEVSK